MEFTITCPDCGKVHKVTIDEVKPSTVRIATKAEHTASWAEVAESVYSGKVFKVGDELTTTLKNGTEVTFVVAHINPYADLTPFDDTQIAFVLKDCLPDGHCMNENGSNKGGFCKSDMAKYLNEDIFALLPDELQAIIKVHPTLDCRLWLPSYTELGGTDSDWVKEDGVPFDLFKDEKSKVKQIDGETCYWWTRSPYAGNSYGFVYVNTNGSSNGIIGANNSYGVAFGFLI